MVRLLFEPIPGILATTNMNYQVNKNTIIPGRLEFMLLGGLSIARAVQSDQNYKLPHVTIAGFLGEKG